MQPSFTSRLLARSILLSVVLGSSSAVAQTTFSNVAWANLGGKDLLVDVTLPATGTPPYPLAIHVHGGGWSGGTHTGLGSIGSAMLQRGLDVASVD